MSDPVSDPSNGYNAHAHMYQAARGDAGTGVLRSWAKGLPAGAEVLDVGAGTGWPLTQVLLDAGLHLWATEPSAQLRQMFLTRHPDIPCDDHPVETSAFFDRSFDAVTMIGVIFLLPIKNQQKALRRLGKVVRAGGQILVSAPFEQGSWADTVTGRTSTSLGFHTYVRALDQAGFVLNRTYTDSGGSHYYAAKKRH